MKIFSYMAVACALLFGCACEVKQDILVEFALSSPNHLGDWQQIRKTLQVQDIQCLENASSLGKLSCSIPEHDFTRAKRFASDAISSESLTVRIKKQEKSDLFEVYVDGKKVNEESYIVK